MSIRDISKQLYPKYETTKTNFDESCAAQEFLRAIVSLAVMQREQSKRVRQYFTGDIQKSIGP